MDNRRVCIHVDENDPEWWVTVNTFGGYLILAILAVKAKGVKYKSANS